MILLYKVIRLSNDSVYCFDCDILAELLEWVIRIPLYKCFRYQNGLYNKLLKKGWEPNCRNMHCLIKDGIYARFVYDYVVFATFLDGSHVYDEDGAQLLFKTKLNRIKQLEKRSFML